MRSMPAFEPRLFLVATPLGNLGDFSQRAAQVLGQVDFVVCEDTRHSRVLLEHHGVRKPLMSLPAFAEGERAEAIVARLRAGESAALITDAGSPAISDPGERLVAEALAAGIEVTVVPGPAAVIAALSGSGLPTGRFHFLGFLPRTTSEARAMLEEVAHLSATLVLYESNRRTHDSLALLQEVLGDRRVCMARELTKAHEEWLRGTLSEVQAQMKGRELLGEVVLVVEGRPALGKWAEADVLTALQQGLGRGARMKELSTDLAKQSGWSSQEVYRLGLGLKARGPP